MTTRSGATDALSAVGPIDWEVEGIANVDAGARPGQTTTLRFIIDKPGVYTIVCPVPGHAEAGMVGRIVVE